MTAAATRRRMVDVAVVVRTVSAMTANVRATCPDCGDVQFPSTALHASRFIETAHGTYVFVCPHCDQSVVRPATPRILLILEQAGVQVAETFRPAELDESRSGRPISDADIDAFMTSLSSDSWRDELR